MLSRERPRIVSANLEGREATLDEEGSSGRASRFAPRLEFVKPTRRLDWLRLALVAILAAAVVAGLWYSGAWAVRSSVAWLHQQPRYQLVFTAIELDPPVPDWFLGGKSRFLESVLKLSGEDSTLSVPSLERGRLMLAFKKSPWVQAVRGIQYGYPNRVTVLLDYCQPVASISLKPNDASKRLTLDENATILPQDEIDLQKLSVRAYGEATSLDALILIGRDLRRITPPRDSTPWKTWRALPQTTKAEEMSGPKAEEVDRRVRSAAKLAGFLKRQERSSADPVPRGVMAREINIYETSDKGLFVFNVEAVPFLWGPGPGEEPAGGLSAEEKWNLLNDWAKAHPKPPSLPSGSYFTFDRGGIRLYTPNSSS